jgi:LysM repeat protein
MHRYRRRPTRRVLIAAALSTAMIGGGFAQQVHAAPRTLAAPHSRAHSAGQGTYTVQPGDTLSAIALSYGITVEALVSANHLVNGDVIVPGQILTFGDPNPQTDVASAPTTAGQTTYAVQAGDTLSAIAGRFGTTIDALATANNLSAPYLIAVGQSLSIPATGNATSTAPAVASAAVYIVQAGDTLSSIADSQGVALNALAVANNLSSPFLLIVGQRLVIPSGAATTTASAVTVADSSTTEATSTATYVVQSGDTLSGIAGRLGFSLDQLTSANSLVNPSALQVGQALSIPAGASPVDQSQVGSILTAEAQAEGLDVGLLKAIAWQESGWQMVTAADGGIGIMQIMPDSVDWVSNTLLGSPINPYDPTDNVKAGAVMLSYYLRVFPTAEEAIAAYHQGMTSVQAEGLTPETQTYVANVLALQQQFDS